MFRSVFQFSCIIFLPHRCVSLRFMLFHNSDTIMVSHDYGWHFMFLQFCVPPRVFSNRCVKSLCRVIVHHNSVCLSRVFKTWYVFVLSTLIFILSGIRLCPILLHHNSRVRFYLTLGANFYPTSYFNFNHVCIFIVRWHFMFLQFCVPQHFCVPILAHYIFITTMFAFRIVLFFSVLF